MGVELVEYPGRCPSGHRCVEAKFISLMQQPILYIINHVSVIIVMKLDAKKLLEEISVGA